MYRIGILSLLLTAIVLVGCDFASLREYEKPPRHHLRVDIQNDFNDDLVVLEIDGKEEFSANLTTDYLLSLAQTVSLPLSEGEHVLNVTVNGKSEASIAFEAGLVEIVTVQFNSEEQVVQLTLPSEPPRYD